MTKRITLPPLLEAFCCTLFGLYVLKITVTDEYLFYLTPRMKPWLFFTCCIMFTWTFAAVKTAFTIKQYHTNLTSIFVLLIPLMLLLLPRKTIDIHELSYAPQNGFYSHTPPKSTNPFLTPQESEQSPNTLPFQKKDDEPQENIPVQLPGSDPVHKTIHVADEDFLRWVDTVYKYPFQYEGWRITIKGMTFYDSRFMNETEFIPARLLMVCCAADLVPYGLICRYDKTNELEKGGWLSVTGTITVRDYRGNPEPQIDVESFENAEPVDAYLYPGF